MKIKIIGVIFVMLFSLCSVTFAFAAQGTGGDELQIMEAQHLEIQLGTAWVAQDLRFALMPESILVLL